MAMGCCSACHRHVMATESACPFCQGAVKNCWSAGTIMKHTIVGVSLIAGSAVLSACPAYGVPQPPMTTPIPGGMASAIPTTHPSIPPSAQP
ncbi:hypothetical protein D3C72_916670 [compost metagenome]